MNNFSGPIASIWLFLLTLIPNSLLADESNQNLLKLNRTNLISLYRSMRPSLDNDSRNNGSQSYGAHDKGPDKLPIIFESKVSDGVAQGELYALVNISYFDIAKLLGSMSRFCDAMLLHIDVKSCVKKYQNNGNNQLHVYVGNEDYQSPDEAFHIVYQFASKTLDNNYIHTQLSANSGPFDTSDYSIDVEVLAITNSTSFIHLSNSARYGFFAKFILNTYLATIGSDKVGFTEIGKDPDGNPKFIKGIQGVIERNIMRYFLALQSYLDNINLPKTLQFEARINRWYDLTRDYSRQLYELGKKDYLDHKRKEYENQLALQTAFNQSEFESPAYYESDEDSSD